MRSNLLGTCFAAAALNQSPTSSHLPRGDCDIIVIYKNSTENEEQLTR